nr:aminotransferase class III-fold pyridoxal phosphate-dependent enzyme [Paracoccus sp. S-4012]
MYQRDAASIARIAHLRFSPLAITGGRGSWLIDDQGRELLDFSASWGAASLGHSHPAVRAAVDRALSSQAGAGHISAATLPAVELAERLLALTPGEGERKVWLGHSGSDANEAAVRAIVAATGRPRLVAFRNAYHGGTAGSMAVSGHPALPQSARAPGLTLLPYPSAADPDGGAGAAAEALSMLRDLLIRVGAEVGALLYEPIQADGGMIVPPAGFLTEIEGLCRRHGVLTVADEVKVGLGRTGRFHAHGHDGLRPDVVILGKGLGGGLPVSAVIGPAAILDHASCFAIQTVHGNPVCAAAALAVLDTIEAEGLGARAEAVGATLRSGLEELQRRIGAIRSVRGRGIALGFGVGEDGASGLSGAQIAALTVYRAWELGLVLYYVGPGSDVLELTPPLTLTDAEAKRGVAILEVTLADVLAGRVAPETVEAFTGW